MRLTGLHHLTAIVRDLDRTTAFYRDLLGLRLVREGTSDDDPGARHFWFALGDEGASVGVVKGLEGIPEDPAYFLPRRFNAVSVQDAKEPFGRSFWVAFRATELNAAVSPLDALRRQGYTVEKVYEQAAGGQRAFLVRVTRPG